MSVSLEGQVAVVVGGGAPVGRDIAMGLADRGAAVAVVGPGPVRDVAAASEAAGGRAWAVSSAWDTREAAERAFSDAAAALGPIGIVVHGLAEPEAYVPAAFMDLDADRWARIAEAPLWATLLSFQAAHTQMAGAGGRIFLIVPTAAMSSAPRLVGATAAGDGQRSLLKASARCWGVDGITINCIAVPVAWFAAPDGPAGAPAPADRLGLPGPALAPPSARHDVAGLIAALAGPDASALTGATLAVDGGVWMTP